MSRLTLYLPCPPHWYQPFLEGALVPFRGRITFKNQDRGVGVLVAVAVSLFLGPLSEQSWGTCVLMCVHMYTHLHLYLFICWSICIEKPQIHNGTSSFIQHHRVYSGFLLFNICKPLL